VKKRKRGVGRVSERVRAGGIGLVGGELSGGGEGGVWRR